VIGKQSLADVRFAAESGQIRYVRFVPIATERNAAKATAIRSPYQRGRGA